MIEGIYKRIGGKHIDLSYYGPQCFICCESDCTNNHYENIDQCAKYAPLKPFDEWYTELQALIYNTQTPYGNEDGSIAEGTDATAEILSELKKDETMLMPMIEAWATGDTPYNCYEGLLKDMQP
jgi:hypothetical protein